jgi:hypothetical protein
MTPAVEGRMESQHDNNGVPEGELTANVKEVIIKDIVEKIVPYLKKNSISRVNETLVFYKRPHKETYIYSHACKTTSLKG